MPAIGNSLNQQNKIYFKFLKIKVTLLIVSAYRFTFRSNKGNIMKFLALQTPRTQPIAHLLILEVYVRVIIILFERC